jgi:hypothetical protein
MTKHARHEREQRAAETLRVKEIEAAWLGSLSTATAQAFTADVAAARARGPQEPPPPMAPGTAPRPPRPGHEPRPSKEERKRSRPFKD